MPEIVPRWEWRTFGDHFGAAETTFAALPAERIEESDELYLLSVGGTDAVKVRDELMDVKHLEQVNGDGLEQWMPVMKAAFPLSAADVSSVLLALNVDAPTPLTRSAYTLAELLDEVVRPNPDLLAVEVHKRRARYTIGGCMAELTDVRSGRASTRNNPTLGSTTLPTPHQIPEPGIANGARRRGGDRCGARQRAMPASYTQGAPAAGRASSSHHAALAVRTSSDAKSIPAGCRTIINRADAGRLTTYLSTHSPTGATAWPIVCAHGRG